MAIHWRCRFKSRNETLYSINIYDATYSGNTPVELTGAAGVFETIESSDKEIHRAVRLTTGTIRLVNTDGIDNLIPPTPKARFVTLTHEENSTTVTDWQGYIQQSQFTQQWTATPYIVELPVISALSILSGYQMQKDVIDPRARIAEYFRQALAATGGTYSKIVFPAEIGMSAEGPWDAFWRFGLLERNWFTYRNENVLNPDETRFEGDTWLDMMDSILESFGYTMYEHGTTIYIVTREANAHYLQIDASALATLAANGTVTETEVSPATINLQTQQIGGNNSTIDLIPALRKAVVEASINQFGEDATPQIDTKFLDFIDTVSVQKQQTGSQGTYYFNETLGVYEPSQDYNLWEFRSFFDGEETEWDGQDITRDYHIGAFCRRVSGEDLLFINFNNVGNNATGWGGDWTISVKSMSQSFFAGGFFLMQGGVALNLGTGGALPSTYKAKFQLRVGNKYYNVATDTWQTTACTFWAAIDPDAMRLKPYNSYNMQQGDERIYIKVPEDGLYGDVELRIYDPESSAGTQQETQGVYVFTDLTIDYIWPLESTFVDTNVTDTNRFVKQMRSFALDDNDKSTKLTSFINSRMGYGVLLKPDYSAPLGKIRSRAGGEMYFEKALINSMYAIGNNPQKILNIPIKRDGMFSPVDFYTWSQTYRYLSSRTNWHDSIQNLQIFKTL